jgi:uncharacterized OsmC-like protein
MSATLSPTAREYNVQARSTDIFGRVLCSARNHHVIIDGPVQNNCPGEELTPAEAFLSGVAACGVELSQVIATEIGVPVPRVAAEIYGIVDRGNPIRPDVTVFNYVRLRFTLSGVDHDTAVTLIDKFKARCPLYGTVAAAAGEVVVEVSVA